MQLSKDKYSNKNNDKFEFQCLKIINDSKK